MGAGGRGGGLNVIPGLHDHHIHLLALAARDSSVEVTWLADLGSALPRPDGWVRAVGWDTRVSGPLDRSLLDSVAPGRPVRVQERTGFQWFLNSCALRMLGLEDRFPDGVLFRQDALLRSLLGDDPPSLAEAGLRLARLGITDVTDATPGVDRAVLTGLPQQVSTLPGKLIVDEEGADVDGLAARLAALHAQGTPAAVHAVTRAENVATVAAFRAVGTIAGDRIEHGAVLPPELLGEVRDLGLTVVTSPAFPATRSAFYAAEVESSDLTSLWRARSLLEAGVPLLGGSDAPVGPVDPWLAMRSAVEREGPERLTPEQALALFAGGTGQCVLREPWEVARTHLAADLVQSTIFPDGTVVEA